MTMKYLTVARVNVYKMVEFIFPSKIHLGTSPFVKLRTLSGVNRALSLDSHEDGDLQLGKTRPATFFV